MKLLPKAKLENIVVSTLKDEVLIYNLLTNQAFCLNDTAGKVFNACDGVQTFADLKNKHQLTDEIIFLALDQLKSRNLISNEFASPFAGLSRREVIRRVGFASLIALPMIASIVAPAAAHAQSVVTCQPANCSCVLPVNNNDSGICFDSDNCLGDSCACFFLQEDCVPSNGTKTCPGICSDFTP